MLEQAAKALTDEAKKGFLDLAQSWFDLAEKAEAAPE
jgi:hypothetical protein